jgi:hypothetical protein
MKKILIIISIAAFCFLIGGGWHFLNPHDDLLYSLYYKANSEDEISFANCAAFLYCGPAAALSSFLVGTGFVLIQNFRRKRSPSSAKKEKN